MWQPRTVTFFALPAPTGVALAALFLGCSGTSAATSGDAGDETSDAATLVNDGSAPSSDAAAPKDAGAPIDATHDGGVRKPDASPGGPVDAGVFEDAGPDDPRLSDPSRPSFPYECQGTPLTVAEAIEHFPLAQDLLHVANATDWNATGQIFATSEVSRTCTSQTGCGAWLSGSPSGSNDPSYWLWLNVSATGAVALQQLNWNGIPILARAVLSGELQVVLGGIDDGVNPKPPATRYVVRMTRNADGTGCFSAASVKVTDAPTANGSTLEHFYVGVAQLPAYAPVPRLAPAPRTTWTSACTGTLAENAIIAGWFSPGSTSLSFANANAKNRTSTQACHPITGCTEWSYGTLPIWSLFGIQTAGSAGFALRLDNNVSVPITHGVPSATVSGNAYTGLVATSGCVSYDETRLTTYTDSAVVQETHVEEQNKAF